MTFDASDELERKHYQGQFVNGNFCGHGTLTYKNGNIIIAKWRENKIHGQGVYIWNNGTRQRVTMQEDEIVFEKRLIFPEEDYRIEYRGDLKDKCIIEGEGSLTVAIDKTFAGNWING